MEIQSRNPPECLAKLLPDEVDVIVEASTETPGRHLV